MGDKTKLKMIGVVAGLVLVSVLFWGLSSMPSNYKPTNDQTTNDKPTSNQPTKGPTGYIRIINNKPVALNVEFSGDGVWGSGHLSADGGQYRSESWPVGTEVKITFSSSEYSYYSDERTVVIGEGERLIEYPF